MNFYNKYLLPRLLNFTMDSEETNKHRPDVIKEAEKVVLEMGFGSGLNLPYYKNITKLYALDPSLELYELAQERIKTALFPVEYLQVSVERIPIPDKSIDVVVSTWSICSIPNPEIALKEIFRILKPEGKFTFIEHGKSPRNFVAKLQRLLTPISKRVAGGCHMDRGIDRLITNAGFEMLNLEKFQHKSKPLVFMYKGVAIVRK